MGILHVWNVTQQRPFKAVSDEVTDCLTWIDYDHYHVHAQKVWTVEDTTADIGAEAGDFISLQFTTPAVTVGYVHMLYDTYSAGAYLTDFREGQTGGGAGGAAVTSYNKWRASTNTAPLTVTKDDTIGTGGTVLFTEYFGAGEGPQSAGGLTRSIREWVLKAATKYQLRVYDTGANAAYVRMIYYVDLLKH